MSHRFIYLAYPIDQVEGDATTSVNRVRTAVATKLREGRLGSYDPGMPWRVFGQDPGPEIARVNHHAMSVCTGAVAILPKGTPTVGVPIEIERMSRGWGMPVAVITDNRSSWSLYETNHKVQTFGWSEQGVDSAVAWLMLQEPGVTPFNQESERSKTPVFWTQVDNGLPYDRPGQEPTRSYPDDAGLDLYVADTTIVPAGEFVDIPTGVAIEMPPHVWGMLTGRSSTLRKKGLMVNQGVIDPSYRGELYSGVWNLTPHDVRVAAGERIAQLILIGNSTRVHQMVEVRELAGSDRGRNGFGSSGA